MTQKVIFCKKVEGDDLMKLITKELEELFEKYPVGSQDGLLGEAKVLVKFFNPIGGGTWLITEGSKIENGDYEMFGYCNLGDNEMAELGYIYLSELENLELPFRVKCRKRFIYEKRFKTSKSNRKRRLPSSKFFIKKRT